MPSDETEQESLVAATPRSQGPGNAPTPGGPPAASTFDPLPAAPRARPRAAGDPLGLRLLKQALFPRRAQPVQIGRYRVLRLLGHGGMGAVYACYDEKLDRRIAVKILQLDAARDRELAAARLVREGQALARLSHPNVVTVHEVGESGHQVYVAMEFIRGTSLDVWAAPPRSWQEILAAFLQAGRGLAAAHRVGIVHRDFKPQNVLMSDEGVVKVLDFGLARASEDSTRTEPPTGSADADLAATPELARPLTRTGALVGTPIYMSPEQHTGRPVTAASDQFSFCVSLYQCLYGVLPFASASLAELQADVIHGRVAAPPPRSPVPARIFQALRRGMAVDPADRFPSLDALLATLERDPAAHRRRIAALAVTAVVTGAAGFALASSGDARIERCPDARAELAGIWDEPRKVAVREAVQATGSPRAGEILTLVEARLEAYATGWAASRNEACRTHAEGHQSSHVFDLRTACLGQRRAGLDAVVDAAVAAEPANLEHLPRAVAELPPLERCADVSALLTAIEPPADAALGASVQAHRETLARAQVLEDAGQYRRGLELVEAVLADEEALTYEPLRAEVHLRKGGLEMESGEPEAAERSFNQALWTALGTDHESVAAQASSRRGFLLATRLGQIERAEAELPMIAALHRRVRGDVDLYAEYLNNTGIIHQSLGEIDLARERYEEARDLRRRHDRDRTVAGIATASNLGVLAYLEGRFVEREAIYRELVADIKAVLGDRHSYRFLCEGQLANTLLLLGRPRAARALLVPLSRAEAPEDRQIHATVLWGLATLELADGAASEAYRHLIAVRALLPESDAAHGDLLLHLIRAAAAAADEKAMRAHDDEARATIEDPHDPDDGYLRELLVERGRASVVLGRPREAIAPLEELTSRVDDDRVAPDGRLAEKSISDAWLVLGKAYHALGDYEAADRALAQAFVTLERIWPLHYPEHADILWERGEVALSRQRPDEALKHLSAAESIHAATAEPDYTPLARVRFALARALAHSPGPLSPAARTRAEQALAAFRARERTEEARAVESWLAGRG